MTEIFIHKTQSLLTPPTEKLGATGIPSNYSLSVGDNVESLMLLENSQPRITYGITEREEGAEHTNDDNQRNIWVCDGKLEDSVVLSLGLLKGQLNGILKGDNFIVSGKELSGLSLSDIPILTEQNILERIQSKDFAENLLTESMLCSKDIQVDDLGEFKIISCLGEETFVFLKYGDNYYDLAFS